MIFPIYLIILTEEPSVQREIFFLLQMRLWLTADSGVEQRGVEKCHRDSSRRASGGTGSHHLLLLPSVSVYRQHGVWPKQSVPQRHNLCLEDALHRLFEMWYVSENSKNMDCFEKKRGLASGTVLTVDDFWRKLWNLLTRTKHKLPLLTGLIIY